MSQDILTFTGILQTAIVVMILIEIIVLTSSFVKKLKVRPEEVEKYSSEKPPEEEKDLFEAVEKPPEEEKDLLEEEEEHKLRSLLDKYCLFVSEFETLTEKLKKALKDMNSPDYGYFHSVDIDFDVPKYKLLVQKIKSKEKELKKKNFDEESFKNFEKYFLRRMTMYLSIEKSYRESLGI